MSIIFLVLAVLLSIYINMSNSSITGGTCNVSTHIDSAKLQIIESSIGKKGGIEKKSNTDSPLHINFLKNFSSVKSPYIGNDSILKSGSGKDLATHSWYNYKSWNQLGQNTKAWHQYLVDRKYAHDNFLFNWELVLNQMMPIVNTKNVEYIGIIRAKSDLSTLYVHKMESSNIKTSLSDSYIRSVPAELVQKYTNIPGYFLFHTHPANANTDPFPSDIDIYSAINHSLDKHYMGEIVIGAYGIIVYYLNDNRFNTIYKETGKLGFYTFCYDVMMAWNSINSVEKIRLYKRLNMLEKFGITMIIIPSTLYIADNHFKEITPNVLCDRFIKHKYELLDYIEELIKREEYKEIGKYGKEKYRLK